jgi:flagellar assembly protein FliH
MPWFEEGDELAQAASFRDVTAKKRPDLSWARPAEPDPGSLRAPRVPSVGLDADAPRESVTALDAAAALSPMPASPSDLDAVRAPEPRPSQRPDAEHRRKDTMIDDIVPRAEEEAFVAIREAVARAEATREQQFVDAERRLVDLAILVARRVIAREVSLDPAVVVGLVREGMAALGERDRVVVRVGTFFRDARDELQRQLSTSKLRCDVVVDLSLGRAGCVVETDLGRVDESIDARLANLLEALLEGSKRPGAG